MPASRHIPPSFPPCLTWFNAFVQAQLPNLQDGQQQALFIPQPTHSRLWDVAYGILLALLTVAVTAWLCKRQIQRKIQQHQQSATLDAFEHMDDDMLRQLMRQVCLVLNTSGFTHVCQQGLSGVQNVTLSLLNDRLLRNTYKYNS